MQEIWVQSLGREDSLEEEMATHSSILAWKIPWTEEPGVYSPEGRKESDMTHVFIADVLTQNSCLFFYWVACLLISGFESSLGIQNTNPYQLCDF